MNKKMSKKNALIGFRGENEYKERISRVAQAASSQHKLPVNNSDILRWAVDIGPPILEKQFKLQD